MNAYDLYEFSLPQFIRTLKALKGCISKAAAHADQKKFDVNNFFQMRLAPDQFNLGKQIQICTDTAKGFAARLSKQTPPAYEDNEKTIQEFQARIDKTIKYLEGFKPSDFEGYEKTQATFPWYPGKALAAKDYIVTHAIPNFYFHMATAYSILRENGVDLGKADYLGEQPWTAV